MLTEKTYIEGIYEVLENASAYYKDISSNQILWEILKIYIKEYTIQYCTKRKNKDSCEFNSIQKQLDNINIEIADLETKSGLTKIDEDILISNKTRKLELESEIYKYIEEKAKGNCVRSRAKWVTEGEICSSFFLGLERQRQSGNVIRKLKVGDTIVDENNKILEETTKYYKRLYSDENTSIKNINSYLQKFKNLRKVNEEQKKFCDQVISKGELSEVVKNLKKNKAPGLDGLTNEFYQTFWGVLEPHFVNMLEESFMIGSLPSSIRKAVMSLIFKSGDKTILSNYRPISVTNSDYKILAFVLAKRLQTVCTTLISESQSGYLKKRYIGFNARLLNDIIEHYEENNKPGAIICLDFEKAFDTLNWYFMFGTLRKFGENFIRWIEVLYKNPLFCIKNNGHISQEVLMKRGVRQGCPVSALLFILSIELLSCEIKENEKICGIEIGPNEYRILQYADDSTLTLQDKTSIAECLKVLYGFSRISGLKLNTKKCQGIWLGDLKGNGTIMMFENIPFTTEPVKCLGIYIGTDSEKCQTKNWEKKLTEIEHLLINWSNRKLTLYGKAVIINSLVIPKLIYNFALLIVPDIVIKKLNQYIFHFLWGKVHKIKKATIIGENNEGGLSITDLESKLGAIKVSWITKILTGDNNISKILQFYLSELGINIEYLLKMNFKSIKSFDIIKRLPKFYQDIFIYYNRCKIIKPVQNLQSHDVMTQILWGNEYFKLNHKTLYFKNWIKSGFILVKDLLPNNGDWLDEVQVIKSLQNSSNWIAEFTILKKVVGKIIKKLDTKIINYIQKPLEHRLSLQVNTFLINPNSIKTQEIYKILVRSKIERPYTEKMWERTLGIKLHSSDWKEIYASIMESLKYKKFAEFKYKVLLNILPYGEKVHKWNSDVFEYCTVCKEK